MIVLMVLLDCKTESGTVSVNTVKQCSEQEACFARTTQVWLAVNHNIIVSLLANEFVVRSVLHGEVSLVAINLIYVLHEAMNCCENLKIT